MVGHTWKLACRNESANELFPLDEQLQTWDAGWSEQVAKYAVWLYAKVDDHWAGQILAQIGGIVISDTSIWRRVKVWGEKIKAQEEVQGVAANALPARGVVIRSTASTSQDMGVAMDAANSRRGLKRGYL